VRIRFRKWVGAMNLANRINHWSATDNDQGQRVRVFTTPFLKLLFQVWHRQQTAPEFNNADAFHR